MTVKDQDAAVHQGLPQQIAGVIYQVTGGEIVRSVDHQVILANYFHGVLGFQPDFMHHHIGVGVVGLDIVQGGLQLGPPDIGGVVQNLALEVGKVHNVEVHDADGAHPSKGQVDGGR